MPSLRDRSLVKPGDKFVVWSEGDPHAPNALRTRKSKMKFKTKAVNKKYRDIKKSKEGTEMMKQSLENEMKSLKTKLKGLKKQKDEIDLKLQKENVAPEKHDIDENNPPQKKSGKNKNAKKSKKNMKPLKIKMSFPAKK